MFLQEAACNKEPKDNTECVFAYCLTYLCSNDSQMSVKRDALKGSRLALQLKTTPANRKAVQKHTK